MKVKDPEPASLPASQSEAHDALAVIDTLCPPCDVQTMARRLNLDPRRVQQLSKENPGLKNDRGEYVCPRFVIHYSRTLQGPKRSRASGLVKKQEESFDIRNARDRAEVLLEWGTVVQRQAVVEELAPLFLAVRNSMRQIPGALSSEIVAFVQQSAEKLANGEKVMDHELAIDAQRMLAAKINDSLSAFSKGVAAWTDADAEKASHAPGVPGKIYKFWTWAKKRFS